MLTIASDAKGFLFVILFLSLAVYLSLHIVVQPYLYQRVNRLEAICIFMVMAVLGFTNGSHFGEEDGVGISEKILRVVLLLMMATPMLMLFREIWRIYKDSKTTEISMERYQELLSRGAVSSERESIYIERRALNIDSEIEAE